MASNDTDVLFTQEENEFLQAISLDMLRTSSSMNSAEQRTVINTIRGKLEAEQYTGNTILMTQQERSLLEVMIKDMYSVSPRRNPDVQRVIIESILGKLEA